MVENEGILDKVCIGFAFRDLQLYRNNVSVTIASKIRDSILSSTNQLEKYSLSGQTEEFLMNLDEGYRYIIRGNYKIIYKIENQKVYVTDVFDTRQNPERLKNRNK